MMKQSPQCGASSLFLLFLWQNLLLGRSYGWVTTTKTFKKHSFDASAYDRLSKTFTRQPQGTRLTSTPFEANLYDGNPYEEDVSSSTKQQQQKGGQNQSPHAVPPTTKLVVGLNKYTHDTSLCAADAQTGLVLFALSKERLSRQKHDAGNVVTLVESCLQTLNLPLDAVETVVVNNHHHRVDPFVEGGSSSSMESNDARAQLAWDGGLRRNYAGESESDGDVLDEYNLLLGETPRENDSDPSTPTTSFESIELSHHLAHAYSTATQAPFAKGLCVVMDGMGECFRTMQRGVLDKQQQQKDEAEDTNDGRPSSYTKYVCDLDFGWDSFTSVPADLPERAATSYFDWREAESVYSFEKVYVANDDEEEDTKDANDATKRPPFNAIRLQPIFKRFTEEKSPPVLDNHGFENMESVGAVYSRASSHIFGDWNACGKVMGLAPWANYNWTEHRKADGSGSTVGDGTVIAPQLHTTPILTGQLQSNDPSTKLKINYGRDNGNIISGTPLVARNDPDQYYIRESDGSAQRKKLYDFDESEEYNEDDAEFASDEAPRQPLSVALDAIALAHRIQVDLEVTALDFVSHFQATTNATNLCLAGGVALNSVLNGRLARELGFTQTFVSPTPGDDGIAVGCCAYGLFGNAILDAKEKDALLQQDAPKMTTTMNIPKAKPPVWTRPLSPYLGPEANEMELKAAIAKAAPWLSVDVYRQNSQQQQDSLLSLMAEEIASGGVVAWYRSRSEMGPRALGHRSILADPRKKPLVRFINEHVKSRESFRPFAPSVLAEEARDWFDLGPELSDDIIDDLDDNGVDATYFRDNRNNVSPFMSMTAMVHPEKRAQIPAVTHVDGSSRLQTVTPQNEPVYHRLISKFRELTGVPMVLNTSFNTLPSEPIVESPTDAIRSFLYSMGSIEMLVMGDYVIKRKPPDIRALLGEASKDGEIVSTAACPKRSGRVEFEASFILGEGPMEEDEDGNENPQQAKTRVRMPNRPMHGNKNEWFELIDELEGELLSICDGTVTLNEVLAQFTEQAEGEGRSMEETQVLLQNMVQRLVRLYEHTFISW